jgi:hypothetical protein
MVVGSTEPTEPRTGRPDIYNITLAKCLKLNGVTESVAIQVPVNRQMAHGSLIKVKSVLAKDQKGKAA